ncbi:hypothetical protein [Mesorhizobium sp. LNJC384A00]|uniref:hypothetical protein n=1 Tax=Mesorhizobium sp. LNJC384A00 TaxID=1287268 RepID=UPI001FDAC7D1|nr:hypothetical protein [Mesorhizobium sp. LNJC384A00]
MTNTQKEAELIARLARQHGVTDGAVMAVLEALRRGGGTMAQFSHVDFGGMSQWSSGMTMVGDMFDDSLKAKLNTIAAELSAYLFIPPSHNATTRAIVLQLWPTPAHGGLRSLGARLPLVLKTICATQRFLSKAAWSSTIMERWRFMTQATIAYPVFRRARARTPP